MTDTEKETKKEKEIFFEKETEKDTAKGRETARETARATGKAAPGPKTGGGVDFVEFYKRVTTGMTMGLRFVFLNR